MIKRLKYDKLIVFSVLIFILTNVSLSYSQISTNATSDIKSYTITGSSNSGSESYAGAGEQWDKWTHKVGEIDTGETLYGAAFGNKVFVVVGGGGVILTSIDGSSWTKKKSGTKEDLKGVSFVNSRFVAVGNNGTILTSKDSKTWVSSASGITGNLYSISYGNGTYVAVGDSILMSADAATWTKGGYTDFEQLNSIAFGSDKFVAVGSNGVVLTSVDGSTWISEMLGGMLYSVVYADNKFVAAGVTISVDESGNVLQSGVIYSYDGTAWTNRSSGNLGLPNGLTYSNDTFVVVGYKALLTSADGETWTEREPINAEDWLLGITYGKNAYVAVGYNGIYQSGSSKGGGMTSKPKMTISPKSLTLGDTTAGKSLQGDIVITNTGGAGLMTMMTLSEQSALNYELINSDACSGLAPLKSCTVTISFSPAAGSKAGKKNITLVILSNDPKKATAIYNISATVVTPKISVKSTTFTAGSKAVGIAVTSVMKISNKGGAPLTISSIDIPDAGSGEFTQTNNCTTVAAGGSCDVTVSFKPASKGSRTATMTILSDDPQKQTLSIELTGKGK